MRDRCTKYLKVFLPILFIFYLGGIVSFTHVHIINGVTIVHAHPYKSSENAPQHEHTGTELQLLHQLSTIQQAGSCLFDFTITPVYVYETTLKIQAVAHFPLNKLNKAVQLRAPPYFC